MLKYKFVLAGAKNVGKSSLIARFCDNVFNENMMDTIGVAFKRKRINLEDNLVVDANIWDFGGQAKFREEYLTNFKKYLEGTNKVIFVIDVQDVKRYELALEYFENIINLLKESGTPIELSIFLHKYDPNLSEKEEFKEIDEIVESKLINQLIGIIPPEFDYKLFKTSIYTVFDKYLIQIK